MTTERFMVDDCGTLIDMQTRDTFDYVSEVVGLLNAFAEENEQLKKENYELHKRLGDFEPFERYMKEITSKTSLEDIISIFKTDEPTNSVELKKELYCGRDCIHFKSDYHWDGNEEWEEVECELGNTEIHDGGWFTYCKDYDDGGKYDD